MTNLKESIRRILKEERNISDIIKIAAKEYNCSTWEINNGYCEDFALNVLEKLGGYEDNLFELSGDMFFNQRDPEFAKENWGDVIETNYGVWSKNLLDYWGYPPNVNLNLVDDEINHVWLFYNGKHYDAEVPEGVDNWFEIPLIKRLFNRYKKNMVQESIRRILKEEISAKEAYTEYDSIKTVADGKRDVAFTTLYEPLSKLLVLMNGLKKIKVVSDDEVNYIVYREGSEDKAKELLRIAKKYGGLLHYEATEEDSRRIGQLLNYNSDEIEEYIDHNRKIKNNIKESIRRILKEETNSKREGMLNIIKEDGLYNFTKDTGLSYNDIYHRMGELPRDVKIQYLKDVISDLQQTPNELDLTFITGSIPLYENDDWQTVYVGYISNRNKTLRIHTFIVTEEGYDDDYDTIDENNIDYETLETLVSELSEKLQHNRN